MALTPVDPKVATSIGDIAVVLTTDPSGGEAIVYEAQVLDGDGNLFKHAKGNLAPHLNGSEITQLQAFMVSIRAKAQALLPT